MTRLWLLSIGFVRQQHPEALAAHPAIDVAVQKLEKFWEKRRPKLQAWLDWSRRVHPYGDEPIETPGPADSNEQLYWQAMHENFSETNTFSIDVANLARDWARVQGLARKREREEKLLESLKGSNSSFRESRIPKLPADFAEIEDPLLAAKELHLQLGEVLLSLYEGRIADIKFEACQREEELTMMRDRLEYLGNLLVEEVQSFEKWEVNINRRREQAGSRQ